MMMLMMGAHDDKDDDTSCDEMKIKHRLEVCMTRDS
jgi:hypothetical protein